MSGLARIAKSALVRLSGPRREEVEYALGFMTVRRARFLTGLYLRDLRGRRRYRTLIESDLLATRGSDTAFLFGSSRSLLEITPAEWERIASYDTVSFREFPRQEWVRADYHVTAEVDDVGAYARRLRENPLYENAVFVLQEGWLAQNGNALVGHGLLPEGARMFRFHRTARGRYSPPSRCFDEGLVHGFNSSIGVTNFAILMGWRRIVLCGIDLADHGYFWLDEGETRSYEKPGVDVSTPFVMADSTVDMYARWREELAAEGVELLAWSSASRLAERLPLLDRSTL